jgi:hypothetical protein
MAKNTKPKITPFAPWETTKPNGTEKRYIRMGNSQMLHPTTFGLSNSAFRVYSYMKLESGGCRSFIFPKCKWKAYISPGGFQNAKKELIIKGFIKEVECNANLRKANVYCFSEDWKDVNKSP